MRGGREAEEQGKPVDAESEERARVTVFFFPFYTLKFRETHSLVEFIWGNVAFSRPIFQKVTRACAKFSRQSFQ